MKHYLLPIFTLVLLATTFSCEKEEPNDPEPSEPTMPPLTHQGLNTFGCYIDGELFVANDGPSVWSIPPVSGSFDGSTRYLKIQGTRYRTGIVSDDVRLRAYIDNGTDSYNHIFGDDGYLGYGNLYEPGACDYYYRDTPDLGKLKITHLDEGKNIIAGTFFMTLTNKYCDNDTIMEITDGRFDFRY